MSKKSILRSLCVASAFTALSAGSAFAAGTAAGTSVNNTFSLSYSVNGTSQPPIDTGPGGSDTPTTFIVDRKVDLTLVSNGDEFVSPGQQGAVLTYTLTNTGNAPAAYDLSLFQESGDDFDTGTAATAALPTITYYVGADDSGTEETYAAGTRTVTVPADGQLFIVITGNIPQVGAGTNAVVDDDEAELTLVADTVETSGSEGDTSVPVVADAGGLNDLAAEENVLADGTSTAREAANAGDDSATGTYIVASADLTAVKTVGMVSEDGSGCAVAPTFPLSAFPGTTAEYAIPGACVEYRITVTNSGNDANANASDLDLIDILPEGLTFVDAFQNGFTGGTFNKPSGTPVCDGTAGACTVELRTSVTPAPAAPAALAHSTTGTIVIRATITAN